MDKPIIILLITMLFYTIDLQAQLGCCDLPAGPCSANGTEAACNDAGGIWYDTGGPCDNTTNDCAHGCCEVPFLDACFGFVTQTDCLNNQPPGSTWTYTGGGCDNTNPPCLNALPIGLETFSATKSINAILLSWITNGETNNEGFEIQISANAFDWEKLDFIKGTNTQNSITEYEYRVQARHLNSGINYFRLKQIDLDTNFSYSNIISNHWHAHNGQVLITPNPVQDKFSIFLGETFAEQEQITYYITDLLGNRIVAGALNSFAQTIDVSNLESGSYLFILVSDRKIDTHKFIKF